MGFNLKFIKEIAVEFAQKLFGRCEWESALEAIYTTIGLGSLSNLWLRNQALELAYAVVVEVDYRSYASKYGAINKRNNK